MVWLRHILNHAERLPTLEQPSVESAGAVINRPCRIWPRFCNGFWRIRRFSAARAIADRPYDRPGTRAVTCHPERSEGSHAPAQERPKPPLCKGRWLAVRRDGGIVCTACAPIMLSGLRTLKAIYHTLDSNLRSAVHDIIQTHPRRLPRIIPRKECLLCRKSTSFRPMWRT